MPFLEKFELVPLENGVMTLRCLEPRETFHPGIGPVEEARILHVEQLRLVERAQASPDFILWDVGFGAAANVLTAIRALLAKLPKDHPYPVTIESFDKSTAAIEFALTHRAELGYPEGFEKEIRGLLNNGSVVIDNRILWNFHLGDFAETLKTSTTRAPDAIFYDPYSVKGNLEMWNLEHFSRLRATLHPERMCLMTNYTASTYVRVTLLLAGFFVGVGCAIDKKHETTIVSNQLSALRNPLDRDWLEGRVRRSQSAAPLRGNRLTIDRLSEEDLFSIRQLPQFAEPV